LAELKTDLTDWLRHFESKYEVESDDVVMSIANNKKGYLTPGEVEMVFRWKLQPNHFPRARHDLEIFESLHSGEVVRKTGLAFEAASDREALEALRGLPQVKMKSSVAVASCILMVLNVQSYTVIDRRANETLVGLKNYLIKNNSNASEMRSLKQFFSDFNPPENFEAKSKDWEAYMKICRELSELSGMTLRSLDRALYSAKGDLSLLGRLR
jgi:hypothetical protein